ncbi:hypothetical protein AB6D78_24195 [Vibrio splendidus]
MKKLQYKKEWALLFIGAIASLISIVLDIYSVQVSPGETVAWFARSGAVVVLFSVIVEYRLSSYVFDDIHKAAVKNGVKNSIIGNNDNKLIQALTNRKANVPKARSDLAFVSHALVIIGTVIWGYGDLLIK